MMADLLLMQNNMFPILMEQMFFVTQPKVEQLGPAADAPAGLKLPPN